MNHKTIALLAVLAVAAPLAAQAEPGHGKGHDKVYEQSWNRGPPGLVKKPYGMPPGQAKKYWSRGERLPTAYLAPAYYVAEPVRYHLAAAPYGYRWVRIDNQYYLAQTRTGLITQTVAALLR